MSKVRRISLYSIPYTEHISIYLGVIIIDRLHSGAKIQKEMFDNLKRYIAEVKNCMDEADRNVAKLGQMTGITRDLYGYLFG